MSSASPVTDGRNVWAISGTGILKAFDFAGKELWTRDLPRDYGQFGILERHGCREGTSRLLRKQPDQAHRL